MEPRPCVIVADDNVSLRFLVVRALRQLPAASAFDLDESDDGVAASAALDRRLAEGRRVFLLSDNQMPGMSGFDLVRGVRRRPETDRVRVAMLTSSEPPPAMRRELEALGALVVERPARLADLRELLRAQVDAWLAESRVIVPVEGPPEKDPAHARR